MIFDELRPYADASERDKLNELGDLLEQDRPVPRAGFRAELGAHMRQLESQQRPAWRPKRLKLMALSYAGSGVALLLIAALGVSGAGPLGN